MTTLRLPAEWEKQDGVLLAWPHPDTDWQPILEQAEKVFEEIALEIALSEKVVIATSSASLVEDKLTSAGVKLANVSTYEISTNDTWARDFGPITVLDQGETTLLNFGFNGWGLKFASCLDNCVTSHLYAMGAFKSISLETKGLILEGGSIESDGNGTILTTAECLLNPNRNPHLSRREIEDELLSLLGSERVLWLENGYLSGDDTDSHIDTLARFAPEDTILYVACDDPEDEHFESLHAMKDELEGFLTKDGQPYRLLPLPLPQSKFGINGERLPATYANFLVINGAVLVPTYKDPADSIALDTVGKAFPGRKIKGINCLPLIEQHGSLHCVTMQFPEGVLS